MIVGKDLGKINFQKFIEYLSYSIIFLSITGPALPDIIASFISIYFFYKIIKEKKYDENFYILIIPFIFLLIPNLFSPYAPSPFIEQIINFRYFVFALFFASLLKINFRLVIMIIMYSTIFISIDLVYQYLFKINIIGIPINPDHNYGRASSFFKEELIAGSYIYKFSLPVIGYFLFHKKFIKAFLLINLYLIAIICSGERMSFLLYSLGILIFLIFVVKDIKRILIISISMLTIFAGSFYIFDGVKGRVDNFIVSMGFKNERIQDFGHAAHFMTAYQIFKENKIFGTGHKTFRLSCNEKRIVDKVNSLSQGCTTHPHNNYFEILTDSGLVGMIGFILLISLILIKAIKSKLIQKEACGFLISFITIIWPISSAGNFFNNRIAIVNFFIIGFILLYSKKKVLK